MRNTIDTITAQATPAGRGGVAIIRVSGPIVKKVIFEVLRAELKPRKATYLCFHDSNNNVIDAGIAIFFPSPHSYTGEDILEFHGHGSPVVMDMMLQRLLSLGVRMARPGEFSERAFLNGKMDLAQAEAVADLINASSAQAARSALRSLQGEFSRAVNSLLEELISIRIYIEAAIDFAEEEIDFLSNDSICQRLNLLLSKLEQLQIKAKQGSLLREGIIVVLAGKPNVGKSSLLNQLSGKDIAIVTDVPGTTRDILRDDILIDDIPIRVIDTAGLRTSHDVVEQEGIKRAHQEIKQADILLYVVDAGEAHDIPKFDLITNLTCPVIFIRNKIDLVGAEPAVSSNNGITHVLVSAKLGTGVELLKQQIKLHIGFQSETDGIFLARRRHLDAIMRAYSHVKESLDQLNSSRHGELVAEDLRQAQNALNEITGEFTADDLLGRIFSSFCIGK